MHTQGGSGPGRVRFTVSLTGRPEEKHKQNIDVAGGHKYAVTG